MISLKKWKILTPLQKLPKNVAQFGQNKCCHMLWKVAQSAINCPIWPHCSESAFSFFSPLHIIALLLLPFSRLKLNFFFATPSHNLIPITHANSFQYSLSYAHLYMLHKLTYNVHDVPILSTCCTQAYNSHNLIPITRANSFKYPLSYANLYTLHYLTSNVHDVPILSTCCTQAYSSHNLIPITRAN